MNKSQFKELRLKCGLTQKEAAELFGVSERMIRHKESLSSGYRITLRDKKALEGYYKRIEELKRQGELK